MMDVPHADPSRGAASWAWLLALYTLASLIETVFYSHLLAFTPLFLPDLGVAPADVVPLVGWITSLSNAVGIPFLPLWGALADRYSRQPLIVRSFVVLFLAAILSFFSRSLWLFVLARSLTSFALGNSGLMLTTLSERVPQRRLGLSFAIMSSASPIGAFLGPLLGGPLVDRWGFQRLLLVDGVLLLLIVLALVFGYRDRFVARSTQPVLHMALDSLRILWRSLRLRLLFPAFFLLFAGWMMAFTYVPLAVAELYQGDEPGTVIGLVLGASGFTTLLLGPLLGALADRYGHWRVLFIGAALSVLLWPLPALTTGLLPFAVAWSLLNGLVSAVFAISFTVLSLSAPSDVRARVMSLAYLPVNVGFMVGPAIGTAITQRSLFAVFPAAALLTMLGLATLLVAYRQGSDVSPETG